MSLLRKSQCEIRFRIKKIYNQRRNITTNLNEYVLPKWSIRKFGKCFHSKLYKRYLQRDICLLERNVINYIVWLLSHYKRSLACTYICT